MNSGICTSLYSLLALFFALTPTAEGSGAPSLRLAVNNGFCENGVFSSTRWTGGTRPGGLTVWGSFCGKGNDDVGRAESQVFVAPSVLNMYLAGYPGLPGRRMILRNVESREEKELTPPFTPAEDWHFNTLPVPPEWVGQRVQLIAEDNATGPGGWLGFSLPVLPVSGVVPLIIDTSMPPDGYCQDGVYGSTRWPDGVRPKGVTTWGSFCKSADKGTGWAGSQPVSAGSYLNIYLAGYPDTPGLPLAVENLQTGQQLPLHPISPEEKWELQHFRLPVGWKGQLVRLISKDQATGINGWAGFSDPLPTTLSDVVLEAAKTLALAVLLATVFLIPSIAAYKLAPGALAAFRIVENSAYLTAIALFTLGLTFWIYHSLFWSPDGSLVGSLAASLAAGAILARFSIAKSRASLLRVSPAVATEPARQVEIRRLNPRRRLLILILAWGLSVLAVLPAIFHWTAPPPFTGSGRDLLIDCGYLVALVICYSIYRVESRRLRRSQALILVFVVFLLTGIVNNLHSYNVDQVTRYLPEPNYVAQSHVQDAVIQLVPMPPHSYRFLPNSIVRWMQLARMGFEPARDLYRLIVGLLLFYSIYRYARRYCNYTGAFIAMLFIAAIYPVSFEYYVGQLADPLSHLSFVLAFIFLETEEFALLLTTLLIGSLAKETVLAMAGYYLLFCRKEKHYPLKAAVLCIASVASYFGVRLWVLHGTMQYIQASNVTPDHVLENWDNAAWGLTFLLTACALLPFLALGWKETAPSLKHLALYLLPVLFISSLFFSWLREGRNFMPLVFVLAVSAGGYLSRQFPESTVPS